MKSTNFEFLREKRPELADLGGFAEYHAKKDPSACLHKLRLLVERMTKVVYDEYRLTTLPRSSFNDLLIDDSFKSILPNAILDKMHALRIRGNDAVHGGTIHGNLPRILLKEAFQVSSWFHLSIDDGKKNDIPDFVPLEKLESESQKITKAYQDQLDRAEREIETVLAQLEEERIKSSALKLSTAEEKESFKTLAEESVQQLGFNEAQTRKFLIDSELDQVGWKVNDPEQVGIEIEVDGQPTPSGKGFIDYVLWGDNGKPLAIIEAKRTSKDAQAGQRQAKLYADALEKQYDQRPFIFFTNGHDISLWNDSPTIELKAGEVPRKIFGYYSKDSLESLLFQRKNKEQLGLVKPKLEIADRMYQQQAIRQVTERFADGYRKALIVQATGTGKTRVAISLCDFLSRAKWAKRILFLCDRRELLKQADKAFKEFLPSASRTTLNAKTAQDRDKRVYLATYPAMIKQFNNFDVGFFDLVIADESHRSIYNKYRDLFRYFDAFQIGLTATPRNVINHDTYDLFKCEDGNPTAHYGLREAIEHVPPHLLPFRVVKLQTKFQREGIKWQSMTDPQKRQYEAQMESPEEEVFESKDIDNKVFNRDTSRSILRNLMDYGIRDSSGSLPGKSIIFARNHKHAMHLYDVFQELYPKYGGDFCYVIDGYDSRAEQLIDDFKNPESSLRIAISVDMLDTGIDVPEIVNLVFAKSVKSYVKFWQMIGRGTRLCENLFGLGKDKTEFLIFDHRGNFEYFDEHPEESIPTLSKSLMQRLFEARLTLALTASEKMKNDVFLYTIDLIRKDLNAIKESKTIEVRDHWTDIQNLLKDTVLEQFDGITYKLLFDRIAPLARWIDIRKNEDARRFDLLMCEMEIEHLRESSLFDDLRADLHNEVDALRKNLNQVKAKSKTITQISGSEFWKDVDFDQLEHIRIDLRGIIKHKMRTRPPKFEARYIDVKDGDEIREEHIPTFEGQELIAYRHRVENALEQIKDDPILMKIQAGYSVSEADIENLSKMILSIDPHIRLRHLPTHFNLKGDLYRAIRSIVGLDIEAVDAAFRSFISAHSELSAQQLLFLRTLKSLICENGGLKIERLWEDPFTHIAADGVDGLFSTSETDDILNIVEQFEKYEIQGK